MERNELNAVHRDAEEIHDPDGKDGDGNSRTEDTPKPPPQGARPSAVPEGGLMAWLQVLGCFMCWFNSWGLTNAFGVFQTFYETDLLRDKDPSQISWIGTLQSFLLIAVSVLVGPAYDAGYFTAIIWTGSFLVVFGFMMTSLCTEYYQLMLAQGVVIGLGTACQFIPAVAILPQYFQRRRSLVNGIAAAGSGLGGVIYPIVFHKLHSRIGFPWATRVLGFIALATSAVSISVCRVRVKPAKTRLLLDRAALRSSPFLLFSIADFFTFAGLYTPTFYVQTFASRKHIVNDDLAAYILPILNTGGLLGRIIPNLFADRTGPLNVVIPSVAASSLLAFCWIAATNITGLILFALIYGFFIGTILSLLSMVIVSLAPNMGVIGTWMGMSFFVLSLGLLVGNPVCGAILTSTGSFVGLQVFAGVMLAIGTALSIAARVSKAGPRLNVKA